MERTVRSPDQELLTTEEFCKWLGISDYMLEKIQERGILPAPIVLSKKHFWDCMDAVAIKHLLTRGIMETPKKAPGESKKPAE